MITSNKLVHASVNILGQLLLLYQLTATLICFQEPNKTEPNEPLGR